MVDLCEKEEEGGGIASCKARLLEALRVELSDLIE